MKYHGSGKGKETETGILCHTDYFTEMKLETDRYIFKALFELMEEAPFEAITVSMVCRQAQIGRKTFYRHFSCVPDVLDDFFRRRCMEYLQSCKPLKQYSLKQTGLDFFHFWQPYTGQLAVIQQSLGYGSITSRIFKYAVQVVEYRADTALSTFAMYSAGGLCVLLETWIMEGCLQPPEKIVEQLLRDLSHLQTPSSHSTANNRQ